jgi:hypothetical protein
LGWWWFGCGKFVWFVETGIQSIFFEMFELYRLVSRAGAWEGKTSIKKPGQATLNQEVFIVFAFIAINYYKRTNIFFC